MKALTIALGIVAAGALTACGSSGAPSVGAIGKAAYAGSIKLTLQQFNDPAHGSGVHGTPSAGNRFVAAQFQMSNPAPEAQGLSADEVAAIGSNSLIYPTYNGGLVSVAGCTNFDDTGFNGLAWNVGSHATITRCTVFELPVGIKVRQIIWGFGGQFLPLNSTTLLWTISHSTVAAVPKGVVTGTVVLVHGHPSRGVYSAKQKDTRASSGTVSFNLGGGNSNINDTTVDVGSSGRFRLSLPPGRWYAEANLNVFLQGPSGPDTGPIVGGGRITVTSGRTTSIIIWVNVASPGLGRVLQ